MNQEQIKLLYAVAIGSVLLSFVFLTGCSPTIYTLGPKLDPFIRHNGVSECVSIPVTADSYTEGNPRAQYDIVGIEDLKCGLTPTQALDYFNHVEAGLNYYQR